MSEDAMLPVTFDSSGNQIPFEAAKAEASNTNGDGTVTVSLCGEKVRILPIGRWKTKAQGHLRNGDFDAWAMLALADDDYEEVWEVVEPTNDDVEKMFEEWQEHSGQNSGKARRSRRS